MTKEYSLCVEFAKSKPDTIKNKGIWKLYIMLNTVLHHKTSKRLTGNKIKLCPNITKSMAIPFKLFNSEKYILAQEFFNFLNTQIIHILCLISLIPIRGQNRTLLSIESWFPSKTCLCLVDI